VAPVVVAEAATVVLAVVEAAVVEVPVL